MSSIGAPIAFKMIGSNVSEADGAEAAAIDTAVAVTLENGMNTFSNKMLNRPFYFD